MPGARLRKAACILLVVACSPAACLFTACTPERRGAGHGTGAEVDSAAYASVDAYSVLDPRRTQLPPGASLLDYCPTPGGQGSQSSCVGWSASFCARTILQAVATGQPPDSVIFSPSFVYNAAKISDCYGGTHISRGLAFLRENGTVSFSDFPYSEAYCDRLPSPDELARARKYRIRDYTRLSGQKQFTVNLLAVKQHIAQRFPVVVALPVGKSWHALLGHEVWAPSVADGRALAEYKNGNRHESGLSGHALAVVAYDDTKYGGAVLLFNSWGTRFGRGGKVWVRYADFADWCIEAYGVYGPPSDAGGNVPFQITLGLRSTLDRFFYLGPGPAYSFITQDRIPPGEKFKLEASNTHPCYFYAFGRLPDGRLEPLFPASPQHSAYIGVTGTRVLPEGHSLMLDADGAEDQLLLLFSQAPLPFDTLAEELNRHPAAPLLARLRTRFPASLSGPGAMEYTPGPAANVILAYQDSFLVPVILRLRK